MSCLLTNSWGQAQNPNFSKQKIFGTGLVNPTSLQFGPDGLLYVSEQLGLIKIFQIERAQSGTYSLLNQEVIDLIQNIPNHDDNGVLNLEITTRQVTGILVVGTADNPEIYVTSSDPRIGGGGQADTNLDTNSGVISKLYKQNGDWKRIDLVRGLPRSEENHSQNGLDLILSDSVLLVTSGGNTNQGAPSNNFAYLPEYAYSAAILSVDLKALYKLSPRIDQFGSMYVYDLPTLNDEERDNTSSVDGYEDTNDPFGGNDGKNQAKLIGESPVQIYSPGWRNAYDVLVSDNGFIYTYDNGSNKGWGGIPINGCSNEPNELLSNTYHDNLHRIAYKGYYGGHPNPTRANPNNTFNETNPQSAVEQDLIDIDCRYLLPGEEDGAIATYHASTNGLAQYTATNFDGAMVGDLLAVAFDGKLLRYDFTDGGDELAVNGFSILASSVGTIPLDITAQGDFDVFPGTIWVCNYASNDIIVFTPEDFQIGTCELLDGSGDDDNDGYTNQDENLNNTNPCNPIHTPSDFDKDGLSDLLDTDDDNDGIEDVADFFALDISNGSSTDFPYRLDFDNQDDGGLNGWGFTGLMTNGSSDYLDAFEPSNMTVGGAGLKFTIDEIDESTSISEDNTQKNAFHFGIHIPEEHGIVEINTRIQGPLSTIDEPAKQSYGLYVGTGDQDNYISLEVDAGQGSPTFKIVTETNSVADLLSVDLTEELGDILDLQVILDFERRIVHFTYSSDAVVYKKIHSEEIPEFLVDKKLAVGIKGSSGDELKSFTGTWDFIEVQPFGHRLEGQWQLINTLNSPVPRHENSFVQVGDKLLSIGGRGRKQISIYDPEIKVWTEGSIPPIELHHFQGVVVDGLVYVVGAFTGAFPNETPVKDIYIYDLSSDSWYKGPAIMRPRGAAGCIIHDNFIYLISGITNGHNSGWVNWVDRMNISTGQWESLADIPNARDHFFASSSKDEIYVVGGRRSGEESYFSPTIKQVDVFDIEHNSWRTLSETSNLPTGRAGAFGGIISNQLIIAGGEDENEAKFETEVLNLNSLKWGRLSGLIDSRHGTQAVINNDAMYVANGSGEKGGAPELVSIEVLTFLNEPNFQSQLNNNPSISIKESTVNLDPFSNDKFTLTFKNLSETSAGLVTKISFDNGLNGIELLNATLPIIIPPKSNREVLMKSLYKDDRPIISQVTLEYTGSITPATIEIFRSNISPKNHNIDIGGAGGWRDTLLFSPDNYFLQMGGAYISDDDSKGVPFKNGVRGENLEFEVPTPSGLYDISLYSDKVIDTPTIGDIFLEDRLFLKDQLISPDIDQSRLIFDFRTIVKDDNISLKLASEDFIVTGLSYTWQPPNNTTFELKENELLPLTDEFLIVNKADTLDGRIGLSIYDLPKKGSILLNGRPLESDELFMLDTVTIEYSANPGATLIDSFKYALYSSDSIAYNVHASGNIIPAIVPIALKPNPLKEILVDEDEKLEINYSDIITNPDNTLDRVRMSNSPLTQWLSIEQGKIQGTPENDHVGRYGVLLTFVDINGSVVSHYMTIEIINTNDPPKFLTSFPDMSIQQDTVVALEVSQADIEDVDAGDQLIIKAISVTDDISDWVRVNGFTILLEPKEVNIGEHLITVSVQDNIGAKDVQDIIVNVLAMPEEEIIEDVTDDPIEDEEGSIEGEGEDEEDEIEDEVVEEEEIVDPVDTEESTITNTAPVFNEFSITAYSGETWSISKHLLETNFNDIDSMDDQQIEFIKLPQYGLLIMGDSVVETQINYHLEGIDSVVYIPLLNQGLSDSIQISPFDGTDSGNIATILIDLIPQEILPLGANDISGKYLVYPNPTHKTINIKSPLENVGKSEFWLISMDGKILEHSMIETEFLVLDITYLPSNPYLLIIRSAGHIYSTKVMKSQ